MEARVNRSPNYRDLTTPPCPRVSESKPNLSKAEVRVLIAEIKIRLDMIETAYEAMEEN